MIRLFNHSISGLHIHFNAKCANDFSCPITICAYRIASRKNRPPCCIDDILRVHIFPGNSPVNIRNHFVLNIISGVSYIIRIRVQTVYHINEFSFFIFLAV